MKRSTSIGLAHDLGVLYQLGALGGMSDRELLGRFEDGPRDEAERAFEAIVGRHGSMVLSVCRRVGLDEQTAEDAFQATFLVLALRAGSIRRQESLASWLHGVAARVSRRARARIGRQRTVGIDPGSEGLASPSDESIQTRELGAVLDDEIRRLPAAYRQAVILCYFEGKTQEAAARELGWAKGTVSGRLARAKAILRSRLVRRGFGPSAGLVASVLGGEPSQAAVPAGLIRQAVRTAIGAVLGRAELAPASVPAVELARGALRSMLLGKLAAAVVLMAGLTLFASAVARTAGGPGTVDGTRTARASATTPPNHNTAPKAETLPLHARARFGTTRLRHDAYMAHVAFSADGKSLATTGWDGTVRIWDTSTGESWSRLPRIEGDRSERSVAFSPDGKTLAIGHDTSLQLWDLRTGRETFRSEPLKGGVRELVFSPDGKTLATATTGSDPAVRLWDVATPKVKRSLVLEGATDYAGRPLAFSPDGRRLAVGSLSRLEENGEGHPFFAICDVASDAKPVIMRDQQDAALISLLFTPDGSGLHSAGFVRRPAQEGPPIEPRSNVSPTIRAWDPVTGRLLRSFDLGGLGGHCALAATPDGRTLVSVHPDRAIVWDAATARQIRSFPIEQSDPGIGIGGCLAVSPDGRILAAARSGNAVHLWNLRTGQPLFLQPEAHEGVVSALCTSPDGSMAATGDDTGMLLVWDLRRRSLTRRLDLGGPGKVHHICFAPDGRTMTASGRVFDYESARIGGIIRVWDIESGKLRREIRLQDEPHRLAYSPDGRQLAVSMANSPNAGVRFQGRAIGPRAAIQVFNLETGKPQADLGERKGAVHAIVFDARAKTLASIEYERMLRVRDAATGALLREFPIEGHRVASGLPGQGQPTELRAAAISPDLSVAATAGWRDDRLLVWDFQTGRARRTIPIEPCSEALLSLSPDGRFVAAAVYPVGTEKGAFIPVKIAREMSIRVWEIATKREVLRLEPKSSAVQSLAFTPDGRTLVSGMADTTVILWDCSALATKTGQGH